MLMADERKRAGLAILVGDPSKSRRISSRAEGSEEIEQEIERDEMLSEISEELMASINDGDMENFRDSLRSFISMVT